MEELLFVCPTCGALLTPPEEGWGMQCPQCNRRVDLTGQFAYVRAFQAFEEAAEVFDELKDLKKLRQRAIDYTNREQDGYMLFGEAYSALQEAFRYELAENQHQHGVKMMISVAQLFVPRGMISGMEATYWNSLMVEQVAHKELAKIEAVLADSALPPPLFQRLRLRLRRGQLKREIARLDKHIRSVEKGLELAHNFHPYRGKQH